MIGKYVEVEPYMIIPVKPDKIPIKFKYKKSETLGLSVHLTFKNGIYWICRVSQNRVRVTCQKWIDMYLRGQREYPDIEVSWKEIKCLAGFPHNHFQ